MDSASQKLPRRGKSYKSFPANSKRFSVLSGGAENAPNPPGKGLTERCKSAGAKLFSRAKNPCNRDWLSRCSHCCKDWDGKAGRIAMTVAMIFLAGCAD